MSRIRERITVGERRPGIETAFAASPEVWLPEPARHIGPSRWSIRLHAGPAHHDVAITLGAPWSRDGGYWRRVDWMPLTNDGDVVDADRMFPALTGELGLVPGDAEDTVELTLVGSYTPPGGPLGAVLDRVGLHAVAVATASRFLSDVRERLRDRSASTLT